MTISLINSEGSTLTCPARADDCVQDPQQKGFVKQSDAVAGIKVDWKSRPLKIVDVRGAAAEAGVRNDDILLEIDGNKIAEPLSIFIIMRDKQPGDQLKVKVMRAGTPIDFAYKVMQKSPLDKASSRATPASSVVRKEPEKPLTSPTFFA